MFLFFEFLAVFALYHYGLDTQLFAYAMFMIVMRVLISLLYITKQVNTTTSVDIMARMVVMMAHIGGVSVVLTLSSVELWVTVAVLVSLLFIPTTVVIRHYPSLITKVEK